MRVRWLVPPALALLPPALGFRLLRVADADMGPSIRSGDWVLVGPGEPDYGDVWLLEDPAEPGRRVLRRVLGLGGDRVRWRSGRFVLNGEELDLKDMGEDALGPVYAEANRWLVSLRRERTALEIGPQTVPEDSAWLLADGRDRAVDSRWWGPLPLGALEREVWLRLGPADLWRAPVSIGARDGPWYTPPPS